jgi:hypothetical protein
MDYCWAKAESDLLITKKAQRLRRSPISNASFLFVTFSRIANHIHECHLKFRLEQRIMTCLKGGRKHMDSQIDNSRGDARAMLRNLRTVLTLVCVVLAIGTAVAQTPAVGAKAPDFTLDTPTGNSVSLAKERAKGTTVLVLLRGFPGYQCPYCVRQVHDFMEHSADFAGKKVNVLLVYPGPPANLDQHAKEFLAKQSDLPPTRPRIHPPSFSTRTATFCLRRSATVMATVHQQRTFLDN